MAWSIFDPSQGGGDAAATAWAQALLKTIGAPVTPQNMQFVYDWEKAEGGGGAFNPLNQGPVPGHPELTTTGSQYGGGAADFAGWSAGLQGADDYLHMSSYSGVLNDLMKGNTPPNVTAAALWQSPWAASHYGYGSHWPSVAPGSGGSVPPQLAALSGGVSGAVTGGVPNAAGAGPTAQLASSKSGGGIDLNPLDWVASFFSGLTGFFETAALRLMLGAFGGVLLIVGLYVFAKGAGADISLPQGGAAAQPQPTGGTGSAPRGAQQPAKSAPSRAGRSTAGARAGSASEAGGMEGEAEEAAEAMA